ncbi:putative methyltransferase YcgJ [Variibacter gotjawalensis]|uniref:Putative methyltransferase YcgJ n=1 Tax=Variibacter gotjawalensis TaxID=1333996 RepID=A0A0S3PV00_9BRAD|nr:class I SAM-dependent methyltransferase [Variibacter gotjawalensis]NIK50034.1 ubiquinone/menaquinone biosynthesis C-methylase UbiE [Variibacter gotjawalensis]RZS46033.1 methyltransferase family protein [Variibacter gotjawalensis]BAT59708.1 putative methyltransferase YcgJ [Variibacter gotjawalensis]
MTKSLSQEHFGARARDYVQSKPHAQGKSLERLTALTEPQSGWQVLDVATGAGHVAYAFAPHVARVWATDITDEMLAIVREQAAERKLPNIRAAHAKAESLPFEDATFDLVTSRIAPHHFDSIADFLSETRRVLKPGGIFALVDNVVPEGAVGDYVNAFERFRDPSHLRAWDMAEWRAAISKAGLSVTHEEEIFKRMEFASWAQRHDANMQRFLRAMLIEATPAVREFLQPAADGSTFRLSEGLFIAKAP